MGPVGRYPAELRNVVADSRCQHPLRRSLVRLPVTPNAFIFYLLKVYVIVNVYVNENSDN